MRIQEILPACFDSVSEIIDISRRQLDLRRHLGLPQGIPYRRHDSAEAGALPLPPGAVLVSLVGPDSLSYHSPGELVAALRRLPPGGGALLLLAWPPGKLPYRRLPKPLAAAGCQVTRAIAIDTPSIREVQAALVVVPDTAPDTAPGTDPAERSTWLRLVNERALSDLVARQLRHRTAALGKELRATVSESDTRVDDAERELATARRRIAELESSAALQVGRVVVDGVRRGPARAAVSVPAKLARLWLARRRAGRSRSRARGRSRTPAAGTASPPERAVPITLPGSAAPARGHLTITAPAHLRVPRLLAERGLAAHEPDAMACFLAAIEEAGPGTVLDIGANIGIYAAVASAVSDREVVAFEPTPALAAVARRVAADNALGYAVEALALGAEDGTATFFLSDRSDASNSLVPGFRESTEQITVPVERLDSYVARAGLVPAVMKIDTETTEPEVLKGASKAIAEHRPWILCEVLAGKVEERLTDVIAPFGYHWYQITGQVPYPEAGEISGSSAGRMWLFAPEPPTDRFWTAARTHLAALTGS